MNISFSQDQQAVTFRVAGFPQKYDAVLRNLYYTKQPDGAYTKSFALPVAHLEQIQRNFAAQLDEMLAQIGGFRAVPWEDALDRVASRLTEHGIDWWLAGSCACCISGVALDPHDVDLLLDSKDLAAVSDALADWIIEPIIDSSGWVTGHFGVAFPGARVDLAFDPQPALDNPEPSDSGPYARDHLEEVAWRGHTIKVPPLYLQLRTNLRRGRTERAALIQEVLDRRGSAHSR